MERWSLLALLRFGLAVVVAVNHAFAFGAQGDALAFIPRLGALEAILGFLVISGYSVGHSYRQRPQGYLQRRARRIYPVYLLAMGVTWLVLPAEPWSWALVGTLLANALFLNQLLVSPSYVAAAWSLSLEVWLYTIGPWLDRRPVRLMLALIVASAVFYAVQTAGRSLFHWPYYAWLNGGLNLPSLAFAWMVGWWAAQSAQPHRVLRWLGALLAWHGAVTVAIQFGYRVKHGQFDALVPDLLAFGLRGLTLVVVWLAFRHMLLATASRRLSRSAALHWLGHVSYPLYLLHIPVFIWMQRHGLHDANAMLLAALLAAAVAHHLVETPPWHRAAAWARRWLLALWRGEPRTAQRRV